MVGSDGRVSSVEAMHGLISEKGETAKQSCGRRRVGQSMHLLGFYTREAEIGDERPFRFNTQFCSPITTR